MDAQETARAVNDLAAFLGPRDAPEPADVLILFGGSIPAGADEAARLMRAGAAKRLMLVGGEGHTTETLRRKMHEACPAIETAGRMEADVFADYLRLQYGITPDLIERASTNCGNNVTNALAMLPGVRSLILMQDATMQRRMEAGFRKHAPGVRLLNHAAYQVEMIAHRGTLGYDHTPWGMWEPARYIDLLMGEIPRLTDDENGYGPRGKNFIAHVDVPVSAREAFEALREHYAVRPADSQWASR
ncbi:MAG: YdcF family protein [Eubacteriales bacterium]|nr:YdcF family protein [Eubacteriales bacterium]